MVWFPPSTYLLLFLLQLPHFYFPFFNHLCVLSSPFDTPFFLYPLQPSSPLTTCLLSCQIEDGASSKNVRESLHIVLLP